MSVIPANPERLGQLLRELEDLNIAEKIIGGQIQNEEQQAGNNGRIVASILGPLTASPGPLSLI